MCTGSKVLQRFLSIKKNVFKYLKALELYVLDNLYPYIFFKVISGILITSP